MNSIRRLANACLLGLAVVMLSGPALAAKKKSAPPAKPNQVVLQVSDADPGVWNQALNVARNLQSAYGKDKIKVEIVAFGNGIDMVKFDSTVATRVTEAAGTGVAIVACENTMKARKISNEDINSSVGHVPAGVVELMTKQQQGWAYIKL
jgi:intracellular sulfur oxidation DsrE/DsrF family protein